MDIALRLGRRALGTTSENPNVGCVIVTDGRLVGGLPALALDAAGRREFGLRCRRFSGRDEGFGRIGHRQRGEAGALDRRLLAAGPLGELLHPGRREAPGIGEVRRRMLPEVETAQGYVFDRRHLDPTNRCEHLSDVLRISVIPDVDLDTHFHAGIPLFRCAARNSFLNSIRSFPRLFWPTPLHTPQNVSPQEFPSIRSPSVASSQSA